MFHLSDPSCGDKPIKFVEIDFRKFVPHVSHMIMNKWGGVIPTEIGLCSLFLFEDCEVRTF
jgi:hypothetical protein